ncbi:MAG: hypothetical protein ACI9XR_002175 [Flavobacterium sp.]|jgi:hypothetical protein
MKLDIGTKRNFFIFFGFKIAVVIFLLRLYFDIQCRGYPKYNVTYCD